MPLSLDIGGHHQQQQQQHQQQQQKQQLKADIHVWGVV